MRKSGGIRLFVNSELLRYITVIISESDYIFWFKFSRSFLNTDEDLYFGAVNVPTSESRFNTQVEIDLFGVEISRMSVLQKYVFLIGNFNARTQTKEEFLDADDFFSEHLIASAQALKVVGNFEITAFYGWSLVSRHIVQIC